MTTDVEGELIKDDNGKWLWRTADGRMVAVENMTDSHLRNTALFLMGMGFRKCIAFDNVRVVWLRILRLEWEHRLFSRAENKRWHTAGKAYDEQKELDEFDGRSLPSMFSKDE